MTALYPRGPGAASFRDKGVLSLLRWWLEQPFEYAWVYAFAESRAWLRIDRALVGTAYALFSAVGVALLLAERPGVAVSVCAGVAIVVFAGSAVWWWSERRWPGERQSLSFLVVGELAGLPLAAAAPSGTAALGLMSLYVLPGLYIMFIHSPQILIVHCLWVSLAIVGTGLYAGLATDTDLPTAAVLVATQLAACNGGLIAGQIALTFLRNDARRSFVDPLTGLLNRRGFDEAVAHSITRYRPGEPISVMVADIDKFKSLNDILGHQHGDLLLVDVARALAAECDGHADAIARMGGDEFVAIVHLDADSATSLAHRVRSTMAERSAPATLSVGIHTTIPEGWPPSDAEISDMLALADRVLYATKRDGGDAVTAG